MNCEKYVYKNCPIPGGGYVTGFVFHKKNKNILYCRTDIGGTYRYDYSSARWISLIDHVTMEVKDETFPIALALDDTDKNIIYIACGVGENADADNKDRGVLAVSHDMGNTFEYHELPFFVHGNLNGRGTGFRLIVDQNDNNRLFMASQLDGLWTSPDKGATWKHMDAFLETHMTFVGQSPDGKVLFAAGAGVETAQNSRLRGHSLYVSKDYGQTFTQLEGPKDIEIEGVAFAGHVAQRYTCDDHFLYVTYSVMGRNAYVHENGYSCDGGSVISGKVYRYSWSDMSAVDITPEEYPSNPLSDKNLLEYGFGGICAGTNTPGLLITSTICKADGDCIYRSVDYGQTWECILFDLECGVMDFRTSYMKPEYNGGTNLIHWLTDLKINPFNENEAWFNTGTGVFRTDNLLDSVVHFSDSCDGIEETVHLNLYCPPKGEVRLIDILGDLGGFAFTDLDKQCENSFADENGNRYITCINADYSDDNPNEVIVTPRGNWTGKTKGGLIISHDNCKTWERIKLPYGINRDCDETFARLETPNVNSGWVAMSSDTKTIVWTAAEWTNLPVTRVLVSHDQGRSFTLSKIYDSDGTLKTQGGLKVFSDRVDSTMFVGFDECGQIYLSLDSGDSFDKLLVEASSARGETGVEYPTCNCAKIDCDNKTDIRMCSGQRGTLYMSFGRYGCWKITIDTDNRTAAAVKLSKAGDNVYRIGLGLGPDSDDYIKGSKAIYMVATLDGEYGFYRTCDEGASYTRLNDDNQMFGDINCLEADSRVYGRFFLATGSRGVVYGEPLIKSY